VEQTPARHDTNAPYPAELIQNILDNQSKELELKSQELELTKQRDTNYFEYSKFTTEAQIQNLADERKHQSEMWSKSMSVVFSSIAALTVIVCLALYVGREQFILEIIRIVFFSGCGAIAGSSYQKSKRQEQKKDKKEP